MSRSPTYARIIVWILGIFHRRLSSHTTVLEAVKVQICPHVFNPVMGRTTGFFIRHMIIPQDSRVLEVGTGTGAIAAAAARYTHRVVATDINPYAVNCAQITMRLNQVDNTVEVIRGDLFTPVRGQRFDVILFNPPYFKGNPRHHIAQAWYAGPQGDLITRFLTKARQHLTQKGRIQILFSSAAPLRVFLQQIQRSGFQVKVLGKGRLFGFFETLYLFQLS